MDFSLTAEQTQLRDTVRQFLESRCPASHNRKVINSVPGYDREIWINLGRDIGLGGIHAPSECGGAGLSYSDTCLVLEQLGHGLYCGPYLSSNVLAVNALHIGNTVDSRQRLSDVISCSQTATIAFIEKQALWKLEGTNCIERDGKINGEKSFVLNGSTAELILVIAKSHPDGTFGLFALERDASGLNCTPTQSLDLTRRLARISFRNAEVQRLCVWDAAKHQEFLDLANIAIANEMVGGAQRMLDSALEYSSTRVQFGRTIGSLQAIKHKCAEMLLDIELARSAAFCSARSVSEASERTKLASMAKAMASDAFMNSASQCIQIHGGIGFTWENDTHLWYRRAKSSEVYLGDSTYHRERYLASLGV